MWPASGRLVRGRLAPEGLFIDGTCDEIGRTRDVGGGRRRTGRSA